MVVFYSVHHLVYGVDVVYTPYSSCLSLPTHFVLGVEMWYLSLSRYKGRHLKTDARVSIPPLSVFWSDIRRLNEMKKSLQLEGKQYTTYWASTEQIGSQGLVTNGNSWAYSNELSSTRTSYFDRWL